MKKMVVISAALLCFLGALTQARTAEAEKASRAVSAPVLKWLQDCSNWNCDNSWYSSPAAADLDGDGQVEVLYASYHLFGLRGSDGSQLFKTNLDGRVWPGVIVADIDGDSDLEIATGDGSGTVRVFNTQGREVWSQRPSGREIRSLSAFDLDNDGQLELVAAHASSGQVNTWVYNHSGSLLAGWPQLTGDTGYAAGVYNDNLALGDLDADGAGEIVVPSDVHYICAYEANGAHIPANAVYTDNGTPKYWGQVGVWESLATEIKGWGECSGDRAESYRTNFAHGPAALGDLDGDGQMEVVAVGNVYDCSVGDNEAGARYTGVYVFNSDRSRFKTGTYDWETVPTETGALLTNDYSIIENNQSNPVLADLDGDGVMEILFPAYDGRVHAFWLDKTEHGSWPYAVYNSSEGFYRFATEPVVADLDNDGYAEVIFASWTQIGSNQTGKLHILNYQGQSLHELDLPAVPSDRDWNGSLAAPTLADVDGDDDLELLVNTRFTGLAVYDLPNSSQARILWATGRGSYQRNGSTNAQSTAVGDLRVSPSVYNFGEVDLNETSPDQTFTVTNIGSENRVLGSLSISGTNAGMFQISTQTTRADGCSGQTLAPSGTCTVEVNFTPSSAGEKTANLVIPSDDPDRPEVLVLLSGRGRDDSSTSGGGGGGGGCFSTAVTGR